MSSAARKLRGAVLATALLAVGAPAAAQEAAPAEAAAEAPAPEESAPEEPVRVVEEGDWVALELVIILENGQIFTSNVGHAPLEVKQGAGRWVPGVERELAGMAVGETKKIVVSPEDAYGPVDPLAFEKVPLSEIPETAREPGHPLVVQVGDQQRTLRVHEIDGESAVLDWNHPLAGQTLTFGVRVLEIKDEPAPLQLRPDEATAP